MTGTTPAMQRLLAAAALLVFIIGVPLYVATTATETFFAWTITTPHSAAFLGASYWAAGVLEWLASRQTRWRNSRIAVPAVLLFTVLTLGVTLIHLDRCPCRNNIAAAGSGADQDRESISASTRR